MAIDSTAMFAMSYGLYVVSAEADGLKAGCVVNTAVQVTAEPIRMSVAVHKDNVTARGDRPSGRVHGHRDRPDGRHALYRQLRLPHQRHV